MYGPQRSRRVKAAIHASPPRALRLDLEHRLAARRDTQPDRERQYRARQARKIHAAASADILMTEASTRTCISQLMEDMAAKGASLDVILMAVRAVEAEQQKIADCRAGAAARKRRQRERERDSHATVTRLSGDEAGQSPSPAPSPNEILNPNPTPTRECITPARETDPTDEIVAEWNTMAKRVDLPLVGKLTAERRKRIRARLADHSRQDFTEAIAAVARSSFCRGASEGGWRASFDFLLKPSSFTKLIEGSYDRSSSSRSGQPRTDRTSHPGGRHCAAADDIFGGMAG